MRTLFEATWLAVLLVLSWTASSVVADAFSRERAAFVTRRVSLVGVQSGFVLTLRGGSSKDDEVEEEDDDDEEGDTPPTTSASKDTTDEEVDDDEDEEEDEVEEETVEAKPTSAKAQFDAKLTAATLKSTLKAKDVESAKKLSAVKKAVNAKLTSAKSTSKSAPPRKKSSLAQFLRVPYIVKAIINPLTLFSMTKAFWASLFNLNYVQDMQPANGLELRSALEEKAKRAPPPSGSNKGRRKMKRGQAKTISDLPQLNT